MSAPTNGTITGTLPNVTYTPTAGFTGTDIFVYKSPEVQNGTNVMNYYAVIKVTIAPPSNVRVN